MRADYAERMMELFGERPNLDVPIGRYSFYAQPAERHEPYKRKIVVHMNSYYLPDFIRGMTNTVSDIWINAKEYFKDHVLRHEKIHVAHPDWSEQTVRQVHDFYKPILRNVELVYQ